MIQNKQIPKNPFENENWFSEIIANDQQIQFKSTQTYYQFLSKNNLNTFSMSFKNTYLNIFHTITKSALLSTLVMILLVGSVSASALEIFAPKEFKPSTALEKFTTPKKKETKESKVDLVPKNNPIPKEEPKPIVNNNISETALQGEKGYIIEQLNTCGIRSKIKDSVIAQSEIFKLLAYEVGDYKVIYSKYLNKLEGFGYTAEMPFGDSHIFSIICFDKEYSVEGFDKSFVTKKEEGANNTTNNFFVDGSEGLDKTVTKLPKSKFCLELGLTDLSCKQDISNLYKIEENFPESVGITYFMNYNGKTYLISNSLLPSKGGYQIQFTDVIKNLPVQEPQTSTTPVSTTKTYTNQYFPNFKLVYDQSWKFETSTSKSNLATNLLERRITLSKNGTKLSFYLSPFIVGGCEGDDNTPVKINQKFSRYNMGSNQYVYTDVNPTCSIQNLMKSSILIKDLKITSESSRSVIFSNYSSKDVLVYQNGIVLSTKDKKMILEADQIIKNSSFGISSIFPA
jgi:hypothetical protein